LKDFNDASIVEKIRLDRTKMEVLVQNAFCSFAIKVPFKNLKYPINSPFSLYTYTSKKGNRTFFPLARQFFDLK